MQKKSMRRIILLLVTVIVISYGSLMQASAATYKIINIANYGFPSETMLVGESKQYDGFTTIHIENIDDSEDFHFLNPGQTSIISSNPEVLTAELIINPYGPESIRYEAISPGTAVVTIRNEEEGVAFISERTVTVVGYDQLELQEPKYNIFQGLTMTENAEQYLFFGNSYVNAINICYEETSFESVNPSQINMVSSNSEIVEVIYTPEKGYVYGHYCLKALRPGTATITVTINENASDSNMIGLSRSFDVTVEKAPEPEKGPKASRPIVRNQIKISQTVYYDEIEVEFKLQPGDIEYQIYRSTNAKKGFKRVKTVRVYEDDIGLDGAFGRTFETYADYQIDEGINLAVYHDYKVNPNKKYYYKIRARRISEDYNRQWSKYSKVEGFWTAPKPISDRKVKFNMSTQKVTIPKTKNVTGYIYEAVNVKELGYNIFGGTVYYHSSAIRTTTKRIFKVKKLANNTKVEWIEDVKPYAKHGKYYYVDHSEPVKSLKGFKGTKRYRFAGSN